MAKAILVVLLVAVSAVLAEEAVSEGLQQLLMSQVKDPNACGAGGTDLSSLTKRGTGNVDYKGSDQSYDYYMNVCAVSTSGPDCTPKGFGLCQYITNSLTFVASLGTWNSATWAKVGNQVVATITDGDKCYISGDWVTRTAKVSFTCTGSTSPTFTVSEDANCVFNLGLNANCGSGGGGGGGGDGPSGGTVFIIILVVLIPVYVVVGCIYKAKTKGTTGVESCPNIDFWRDLPGLVKDGFRFVFSKCRGGGSYQQV